jgi:[2Fe-2S] binding domain
MERASATLCRRAYHWLTGCDLALAFWGLMLVASTVFAALAVMDGRVIRGCLALAVEADGREIETIEGATKTGRVAVLQEAFYERAALQCGFCTTAMILQAGDLVAPKHFTYTS